MEKIIKKTKQLNAILRKTSVDFSEQLPYQKMFEQVAHIVSGELFMVDTKRSCLGYGYFSEDLTSNLTLKNFFTHQKLSEEVSEQILSQYQSQANVALQDSSLALVKELLSNFSEHLLTTIPIEGSDLRLGTLFVLSSKPLNEEQMILLDIFATFIGNQLSYMMLDALEEKRRNSTFQALIQTLSRPELESFKTIIEKIDL